MDARNLTEKINFQLKQEDAVEHWWNTHGKALRETLDQYKVWCSIELRKTQQQLARVTEERDLMVKEVLKSRNMLAQMRDLLKIG
jgi:hypothetical protein